MTGLRLPSGPVVRRGVAGAALVALLLSGLPFLNARLQGRTGRAVTVTVSLPQTDGILQPGTDVRYRDVRVGRVMSVGRGPGGRALLTLRLTGAAADRIPATVTAAAQAYSLFGTETVALLPAGGAAPTAPVAMLRDGMVVRAAGADSPALQGTLSDLYDILTVVQPAKLDAALSALAEALAGQGPALGQLISRADAYLTDLAPALPALATDLARFADLSEQLAADAPGLLATADNVLVSARTIVERQQQLQRLLATSPAVAVQAESLLSANASRLVALAANTRTVLTGLAANPAGPAESIVAIGTFTKSFAGVLSLPGGMHAQALLPGLPNDGLLVQILGGPNAFATLYNPPPYTAADCPRYGPVVGATCAGGAGSRSAAVGPAARSVGASAATAPVVVPGGRVGPVGGPAELASVAAVLGALGAQPRGAARAAADLAAGPLLRGTVTVLPGGAP
jgi:virulence factor Mce-like protein